MSSQLAYLIGLLISQVSVNAFVVTFTAPTSFLRLALLPVTLFCVYKIVPIALPATGRAALAAVIGAHSISFAFQYLDTALMSRWNAEAGGPTAGRRRTEVSTVRPDGRERDKTRPQLSVQDRLRFGYWAAVSTRNVGTSFQVSGVPNFSSTDPDFVPSRSVFLRQKAQLLLCCYLVLDTLTFMSQPDQNPILYSPARLSWTEPRNWSLENLIVRSTTVFGFGVSVYCIIQAYIGSVAFISVALGFSNVKSWPPGFGSISEAYSLRRFWGVFWHKYQQQKMSSPASFIANSLLRLPPGSPFSSFTYLFFIFIFSGIMHAASDLAQGTPWRDSAAIHFFATQAFGVLLEDAARQAIQYMRPKMARKIEQMFLLRVIGYLWVFVFLVWSTPVWIYPSLRMNKGEEKDAVVPFSLIGAVAYRVKNL